MQNLEEIKYLPSENIERAFLASIFIDNDILFETIVIPERLNGPLNKAVFSAMLDIQKQGKKLDYVIIATIVNVDVGEIISIGLEVMTSANWKIYEEYILEQYTKRKLLKISSEIVNNIENIDSGTLLLKMKNLLESIEEKDTGLDGASLLSNVYGGLGDEKQNICGYGYKLFDKYLGGFKEGQLVVIGGRPGFGKTAFMIELFYRILKQGIKATIYSLEMSNDEIIKRLLSNRTGINQNELSKETNTNTIANIAEQKIDIMKNAMFYDKIFNYNSIERSIRKMSIIKGHKIVFIDHLGLIRSNQKAFSRSIEIGLMTSGLKILAKELGICIVVLSQLNRNVEMRNDEPELSDLRDSGSIEQDADVVLMLHRDKNIDNNYADNELEVIIRKNRQGTLVKILMETNMALMRITEKNI